MRLHDAQALAHQLMGEHGLLDEGWKFSFDNAVRRFGLCQYKSKRISLSHKLTELNEESQVKDTLLHEIAHAIVGPYHHHNRTWQRTAISIGCSGTRLYDSSKVVAPPKPFYSYCKNCKIKKPVSRRTRNAACGLCCRRHNNNKWTEAYLLTYRRVKGES